MTRASVWSVLVMCSATPYRCGGESDDAAWTFAFVVAADCPAPTETRRGLDAVARQVVQLGPRLPQHNVVVLHSPATSAPPCLTTVRRGAPSVRILDRDPRAPMTALIDTLTSCPARRRALFFVGHTEEEVGAREPPRLGLPIAISALAEWAEAPGVKPFDLALLHCCYSGRIETIVRLASSARWLAVSANWIHPQDIDYRIMGSAVTTDDGRALARRLIAAPGGRPEEPQLLIIDTDGGSLGTFLNGLNSLTDALRRGVESGSLDPLEIGHLHQPVERSLMDRVDLTSLLDYAASAHWLPREAGEWALTAGRALRGLAAVPSPRPDTHGSTQPVITIGFPWHEPLDERTWQAYLKTPFANACGWPQLVADAKRLASRRDRLFLGWELERTMVGQ